MSWLHNMSVPSRSMVVLMAKPLGLGRDGYCLSHALLRGLTWGTGGMPAAIRKVVESNRVVEPWLIFALLSSSAIGGNPSALIDRAARDVSEEDAADALEEAARRRGLTGARMVGSYLREPPKQSGHESAPLSADVELTLIVLSKTTQRIFVAGKYPSLAGIRSGAVIELVGPSLSEVKL